MASAESGNVQTTARVGEIASADRNAEHLCEQQLNLLLVLVEFVFRLYQVRGLPLVETPERVHTADGGFERSTEVFLASAVAVRGGLIARRQTRTRRLLDGRWWVRGLLAEGYSGKAGADVLHVGRLEGTVAADCPRCDGMELACVRRGS